MSKGTNSNKIKTKTLLVSTRIQKGITFLITRRLGWEHWSQNPDLISRRDRQDILIEWSRSKLTPSDKTKAEIFTNLIRSEGNPYILAFCLSLWPCWVKLTTAFHSKMSNYGLSPFSSSGSGCWFVHASTYERKDDESRVWDKWKIWTFGYARNLNLASIFVHSRLLQVFLCLFKMKSGITW